ncbi:MAG TPA: siroheme synthase CysG [Alphaproteobacteria bacterium]|nr:siroheme synthase CysG [Alphaproteobacteria bacterium]
MRSFPLFLKLQGRPVLLAGSGAAAAAKLRLLAAAGARVRLIASAPGAELLQASRELSIACERGVVTDADLRQADLVFGAAGADEADRALSAAARAAGKLVNIVDRPDLSDFTMPAIVDRDEIVVAISTDGASPVLAQRVRAAIESVLPPALGRLARFARRFRTAIQARIAENGARRRFWNQVFAGPIGQAVLAGDERRAARDLIRAINQGGVNRGEPQADAGLVSLVGAGPGDPELLTLRAARALREADVIVYDKLVDPAVLDYARRDARRIYAGKSKGDHTLPQVEINALLIAEAKAGRHVVRLKGGDPFVFGRGGEELEALVAAGIRVDVVPGITAATGCAAYAGFPLTHRDLASSVTFVSGQSRDGLAKDGITDLDWQALARPRQTIVVYMGLGAAGAIADQLIAAGREATTPIAIIENGTRWDQRVIKGELNQAAALVRDHGIATPALLVIDEVTREAQAGGRADLQAAAE